MSFVVAIGLLECVLALFEEHTSDAKTRRRFHGYAQPARPWCAKACQSDVFDLCHRMQQWERQKKVQAESLNDMKS